MFKILMFKILMFEILMLEILMFKILMFKIHAQIYLVSVNELCARFEYFMRNN